MSDEDTRIAKKIARIQIRTGAAFTMCAIFTSIGIIIFYQNIESANIYTMIGLASLIVGIYSIIFFGYIGKQKIKEL